MNSWLAVDDDDGGGHVLNYGPYLDVYRGLIGYYHYNDAEEGRIVRQFCRSRFHNIRPFDLYTFHSNTLYHTVPGADDPDISCVPFPLHLTPLSFSAFYVYIHRPGPISAGTFYNVPNYDFAPRMLDRVEICLRVNYNYRQAFRDRTNTP